MRVAIAWIGETLSGYGSAVCVDCGWSESQKTYGAVALAALAHEVQHG